MYFTLWAHLKSYARFRTSRVTIRIRELQRDVIAGEKFISPVLIGLYRGQTTRFEAYGKC